jgi:hypothetical protein
LALLPVACEVLEGLSAKKVEHKVGRKAKVKAEQGRARTNRAHDADGSREWRVTCTPRKQIREGASGWTRREGEKIQKFKNGEQPKLRKRKERRKGGRWRCLRAVELLSFLLSCLRASGPLCLWFRHAARPKNLNHT